MKCLRFLLLAIFMVSVCQPIQAQSKKKKGRTLLLSASFNFHENPDIYTFSKISERTTEYPDLTFETPISGTFILQEELKKVTLNRKLLIPHQKYTLGFSIQRINKNQTFQEFSITNSSFVKGESEDIYLFTDTLGVVTDYHVGINETNLTFGLRYELGKYFATSDGKLKAGLSGAMIFKYYYLNRDPLSTSAYGVRGSIVSLGLSCVESVQISLSEKLKLEAKVIPILYLGEIGKIRDLDPNIFIENQRITNQFFEVYFKWSAAVHFKYMVNGPKKRSRRR